MSNKQLVIKEIEVNRVVFDPLQPRQASRTVLIDDLASDIQERGQLYPILVKEVNNEYHLLDGERRTRAAILNGQVSIEAMIMNPISQLQSYEVQAVANFKRVENKIQETALWLERFKIEYAIDYPNSDPIARVIELTGYSRNYFESADAINRSEGKFKEGIFNGAIGGYTATEIEGVSKAPEIVRGLQEAYEYAADNEVSISALAPRLVKNAIRDVEKNEEYTAEQKQELSKGLLLKEFKHKFTGNGDGKQGDYLVYLETIRQWQRDLNEWGVLGLSVTEQRKLSSELANLNIAFNAKREAEFGELPNNPEYHLTK